MFEKKYLILVLSTISLNSYSTTYSPPSPDELFSPQLCIVKKDLPPTVKVKADPSSNTFLFSSIGSDVSMFFFKPEIKKDFPKSRLKTQLPVVIMEDNQMKYYDSFGNWVDYGYAFGDFEDDSAGAFLGRSLINTYAYWNFDMKDLKEYLEIPFNYYYKDQYIKNNLRFYTEVKPPGTKDKFHFTGVEVIPGITSPKDAVTEVRNTKIVPQFPLPPGLTIEAPKNTFYEKPKLLNFMMRAEYKFTGKEPIYFMKDFAEDVFANDMINTGRLANMFMKDSKCSQYLSGKRFLASRDKHASLYREFFEQYNFLIKEIVKTSPEAKDLEIKSSLEQLKKLDLYYNKPFGFVFPGSSTSEIDCRISDYEIPFEENRTVNEIAPATVPELINIPKEDYASIVINNASKEWKIRFVRQYIVNKRWEPLDKQGKELSSWNGVFGKPKEEVKPYVNYLKDVKVVPFTSPFAKDELVCIEEKKI